MGHLDMKEIIVDCTGLETPGQLHEKLKTALSFPEWYGNNLDALFDCLCEAEAILALQGWQTLGAWFEGFRLTFLDAAQENPMFTYKE